MNKVSPSDGGCCEHNVKAMLGVEVEVHKDFELDQDK